MKSVVFFAVVLFLSSCKDKESVDAFSEEQILKGKFPFEYSENIPEVDFAFPFDYDKHYHLLYKDGILDTLDKVYLDSMMYVLEYEPRLNILAFFDVDSTDKTIWRVLNKVECGHHNLDVVVYKDKREQVLPLEVFNRCCCGIWSDEVFDIGINPEIQDIWLVNNEIAEFGNMDTVQKIYYNFLESNWHKSMNVQMIDLQNMDKFMSESRDSIKDEKNKRSFVSKFMQVPMHRNTFLSVSTVLYAEISLKEYFQILNGLGMMEKKRFETKYGSFSQELYEFFCPKVGILRSHLPPGFKDNKDLMPPPPEMVPPLPTKEDN
ncbi:MAG: hypothetical protein H6600_04695 [Flavobacteriales bacterium]|nr:hypothetical protein [Flavobacteriales bacterium]MCB9196733.1 hypothetical protein [Flavobacteriales bacterium]MCB9197734.1 hypothetical protein [Flavobacteriales bacterium]